MLQLCVCTHSCRCHRQLNLAIRIRWTLWLLEPKMEIQGTWTISPRSIVVPSYIGQTWCKWTRTSALHNATRKFQKKVTQDSRLANHEFWSPGSNFQLCFYGGSYIGVFWGSIIVALKATISWQQYRYQNNMKITEKVVKINFLCVYPLFVLRPDSDSSQDPRNVR